jgi:nicotinamidase-related amidase
MAQDESESRSVMSRKIRKRSEPVSFALLPVFMSAVAVGVPGCATGHKRAEDTVGAQPASTLVLNLRTREKATDSGPYEVVTRTAWWDPHKTAIIICDMWDRHWCRGAAQRVRELAPRINAVVTEARAKGVLIIHAPSRTMAFYENTLQRSRARDAPRYEPPIPLRDWRPLDAGREPPLPIDDSDGGCDCSPTCRPDSIRNRQISTIRIWPGDAITESVEACYLLQQCGIENVIIMGVHANMCVLGRPFGIRQMVYQGKRVVLVRDLTDTMYNSSRRPFVDHFSGTDLVVEHIEKYWCPTITSDDIIGGEPFRFSGDRRLGIHPAARSQPVLP